MEPQDKVAEYQAPISFRDLVDESAAEFDKAAEPVSEEADERAEPELDADDEGEAEVEEDTEEESEDEVEEEEDEEVSEDEAEEDKKEDDIPKRPIKIIGKDGQEQKLNPNSIVRIKVDGKFEERTLHEVVSQFSGQVVIDRELNKAKEKVREVEAREAEVVKNAENLKKVEVGIGNMLKPQVGATWNNLVSLVQAAGYSPVEFEKALIEDVVPKWAELSQMNEYQRENYFLLEEKKYNQKRQEAASRQQQQSQVGEQQSQQRLKELQTQYGLSDEEIRHVQAWANSYEGQQALKAENKQATPEILVDLAYRSKVDNRAREALKRVDAKIEVKLGDDYQKELNRAKRFIQSDMSIDDEELDETLNDLLRSKIKKAEISKSKKKLAQKVKKAKSPSPKKAGDDDVVTFRGLRSSLV